MSWRHASLALLVALPVALSCAPGKMTVKKGEPQTAREKMLAEEKANKDKPEPDAQPPGSKKWSGWRYQGERKDCFFVVGRKCFKTEKAACAAAKCKAPSTCENDGGGPAMMSCSGEPTPKGDVADVEEKKSDDDKKPAKKSKGK
jgi:hypothetical protein